MELQVAGFADGLPLAGSGGEATLKVQARPGPGPWHDTSSPSHCACAAFVVGVASYPVPPKLPACRNDAEDMAQLLHLKGYNVTRLIDPTRDQLTSSYKWFLRQLHQDTTVVIFFAGHGVQLAGANYLVPLDGVEIPESAYWKSMRHVCI